MIIELFIEGEPVAQPRPRAVSMGGKARMYNPKTAKAWKKLIGIRVSSFLLSKGITSPMMGAVAVRSVFYLQRPKSHYGTGRNASRLKDSAPAFCTKKPDLDNLQKAVFDALTDIQAWHDDSQVIDECTVKKWADGRGPGLFLTIEPIEPQNK